MDIRKYGGRRMNRFVDYIQMNYPEIWIEFHQKMIDERKEEEE